MKKIVFLLILFSVVFHINNGINLSGKSNDYRETIEDLTDEIEDLIDDDEITGASVALVDDQKIVWMKGFGYADMKKKTRTSEKTVYGTGSMTEIFTVPAIEILAEKGKLDISDPITRYIPEFKVNSRFENIKQITIRDLMTHKSGLQSEIRKGKLSKKPERFSTVVEAIKNEYLCFPPDYVFSFSEVGLDLLGIIIERVSGKNYEDFIADEILKPVRMSSTTFDLDGKVLSKLSKPYGRELKEEVFHPTRDIPATGIMTTVEDMAKYMQLFFADGRVGGEQVFSKELVTRILSPLNGDGELDLDLFQGRGWVLSNIGENLKYAGPYAWHDCYYQGHAGRIAMLLKHKLGIIVLANSGSRDLSTITIDALKNALEEKTGIREPDWNEPDLADNYPDSKLNKYAGKYATSFGVIEFEKDGSDLRSELMDYDFILKPNVKGNFAARVLLLGFIRIKVGPLSTLEISFLESKGKVYLVLHRYGERFLAGEKLQVKDVPKLWLKRLGKYRLVNRGDDIVSRDELELKYEGGLLYIYFAPERKTALFPYDDNTLVSYGVGRHLGETFRIINEGGEEILFYSGYKLKKI